MKLKISLCTLICLLSCCKVRQVQKSATDSTVTRKETVKTDSVIKANDTASTQSKKLVISSDSGKTIITIIPDSGQVITFDSNTGLFTGKAKIIESTHNYGRKKNVTSSINTQKDSSKTVQVNKSEIKTNSTHFVKQVKNTESKPNYSWIWYMAAVGAVILFLLWLKFK